MHTLTLVPLSASPKAGSRPEVGRQTQPINSLGCGIGPRTSETAFPSSSEGPEHVDDAPSSVGLSALSVAPVDLHTRHFSKSSEKPDGRAKHVWRWFWPIESKESPTPLGSDEPTLTHRPKSSAIACRLCSHLGIWKPYKLGDGTVSTLRNHLKRDHGPFYEGYLRTDAWETKRMGGHADHEADEPFHLAGLLDRMVRWIVADDQASNAFISFFYALSDAVIVYQRR